MHASIICIGHSNDLRLFISFHRHPSVIFRLGNIYVGIRENCFTVIYQATDMVTMQVREINIAYIIGSNTQRLQTFKKVTVGIAETCIEKNLYRIKVYKKSTYGSRYSFLQSKTVNKRFCLFTEQRRRHQFVSIIVLHPGNLEIVDHTCFNTAWHNSILFS